MKKKNHRPEYAYSEIQSLRKEVKDAYSYFNNGLAFRDNEYKNGPCHDTLIGLLKTHCNLFARNDCSEILSNGTLHTFFNIKLNNGEQRIIVKFETRTIEVLKYFVKIFKDVSSKQNSSIVNTANDEERTKAIQELQNDYENDKIFDGIKKSATALIKYGPSIEILTHVFRFNMRNKNWPKVRDEISRLDLTKLGEEIVALCKISLCECELREAHERYQNDKNVFSDKIENALFYLNQTPLKFCNSENYFYWFGRLSLDRWWASKRIGFLIDALSNLDEAIKINDRWWLQCYRCLVLKILKRKEFRSEAFKFKNMIFDVWKEKNKQPSVKTHSVFALVLLDDPTELKTFLKEMSGYASSTDFHMTIYNLTEMAYHDDKEKLKRYLNMLSNWISSLP